jgi:hypothetical protein
MIGLPASFALTRVISCLLFGVQVTDPATIAAITVLHLASRWFHASFRHGGGQKVDPLVALSWGVRSVSSKYLLYRWMKSENLVEKI